MQQSECGELAVHDGNDRALRQPAPQGEQEQAPLRWHSSRYAPGTFASSAHSVTVR